MTATYEVSIVAQYIIDKCNAAGSAINNLKLQKILYFVQAEFLVETHNPCFQEDIYAWNYGPVVPSVYKKYKVYGGSCIPSFPHHNWEEYGIDDVDRRLIDGIVDQCRQYASSTLVEITHNQAPWKDAYKNGDGKIAKSAISEYFNRTT